MDHFYLLACGMLFSKYGDLRAGWELIAGLQSYDPDMRKLSMAMLARRPAISEQLLHDAIDFGLLLPQDAFPVFHALATSFASSPPAAPQAGHRRQVHEFTLRLAGD